MGPILSRMRLPVLAWLCLRRSSRKRPKTSATPALLWIPDAPLLLLCLAMRSELAHPATDTESNARRTWRNTPLGEITEPLQGQELHQRIQQPIALSRKLSLNQVPSVLLVCVSIAVDRSRSLSIASDHLPRPRMPRPKHAQSSRDIGKQESTT